MLCHHSIGGSIQIVEEYIVGQYYDRCSLVDCNHLQDEMLDVFIRAALFLLQNQVTNTSGTSSNRVRCDQTPRHWFLKIDGILKSMGLQPNRHDPCLYSGFLRDPSDPSAPISTVPITLGLYVDDFVYFSESDDVERRFERL